MPGLLERRFEPREKLQYDPATDVVNLLGGFRGVSPIVGVRSLRSDADVVLVGDVLVRDEVSLRGESLVKGHVLAGRGISVEASPGNTLVVGDLGALGSEEGDGVSVEGGEGNLIVFGNVLAERVSIRSPAIILGGLTAGRELEVRAPTLVLGRVLVGTKEAPGKAIIERATIYQLYAFGNVRIGRRVTLISPIAVARGGELELEDEVRVLGMPCLFCPEVENPLLCSHYLAGDCPLRAKETGYDFLASFDLSRSGERAYLSWYWRASPLMVVQNILAKKLLLEALRLSRTHRLDLQRKGVQLQAEGGLVSVPLEELHARLPVLLTRAVRGEAKGAIEEVKSELFRTVERYFAARGEGYKVCPDCGMPNPLNAKVCAYCGRTLVQQ